MACLFPGHRISSQRRCTGFSLVQSNHRNLHQGSIGSGMSQGVDPSLARAASGLTIGVLLRQRARLHPERPAIIDGSRRFTYRVFNARANRLSAVLRALDIGRGDRVAILSENRAEYLELIFAAGKLGAIVCTLNWRLTDRELLHCVTLTEPRATFVSPLHRETARRLGE